jgi:hypothetical protein
MLFIKFDKPLDILNHRSVNKSLRPTLMALYTSINNLHLTLDCLHALVITLTVLHNIYICIYEINVVEFTQSNKGVLI